MSGGETLLYALTGIGGLFVGLVGWVGARLIKRIDDLTLLLQSDIRELLHEHDKRISKLEQKWFNDDRR